MTIKECKDYIYEKKYEIKNGEDLEFIDSIYQYLCDYEILSKEEKTFNNILDNVLGIKENKALSNKEIIDILEEDYNYIVSAEEKERLLRNIRSDDTN